MPFGFLVEVMHLAQKRRELGAGPGQGRSADLVAAHAASGMRPARELARETQVVLGPRDKERAGPGDSAQPGEVHAAAIHDMEGPGFEAQFVEPEHVVRARRFDQDAGGNRSAQIDLRVHLDAGFRRAKTGPWEKRQGQLDGARVERVNTVVQIDTEFFAGIKRARLAHEGGGQRLSQPPVPALVGVGQRRSGHRLAKAEMITRPRPCIQAIGNIPEGFPPSELRKSHAQQLLPASKMPEPPVRPKALGQARKRFSMNQIQYLTQYIAVGTHAAQCTLFSNASHLFSFAIKYYKAPSVIFSRG